MSTTFPNWSGTDVRYLVLCCDLVLAGVFATSAASKLRSHRARSAFVRSLDPLLGLRGRAASVTAAAVALLECAAASLWALPGAGRIGPALSVLLLGGFTGALSLTLRQGTAAPCNCFGASQAPVAVRHIVRNLLLMALGLVAALHPGPDTAPWRVPAAALLLCLLAASAPVVAVARLDDLAELLRPAPGSRLADTVDARPPARSAP
ncbi:MULTISPECIES: MauE/DoxX family redox-associated membrane protein [Streptacidiphilus]|uniref:MauE/DoxX family redox-associated membrane protein n=1 Tax=Streptacidiphilus cavernicola TaxID=3342716 RepID=A0ABV6UNI9_9ACTN|nr:MauE/DoxX family redox-associated membrane protein [Streptacidiphilus jeojiense]